MAGGELVMLSPRSIDVMYLLLRSNTGKKEPQILARDGREDTRATELVSATLRRRTTCPADKLQPLKACVRRSRGSPGIKSTTPSSWFAMKGVLPGHICAQRVREPAPAL